MFDEPTSTFGRFQVTAALGDGRFGPVHLGVDPQTDQVVVIRTFSEPLSPEAQQRLLDSLQELCARPLDHASVATPIACGIDHGVPYLTHSYLPGTSVDEFLRAHGPRPLAEVTVRVTHLAAAIDFASAAGVHHGTLSPRDIIFAPQSTGVSGFGLVQAMRDAGAAVPAPTGADDIYALAAMTFELLVGYRFAGGNVREALTPLRGAVGVDYESLVAALEPALSGDPSMWPPTALAFAASLQAAQTQTLMVPASSPRAAGDVGRLSFGLDEPESSEPRLGRESVADRPVERVSEPPSRIERVTHEAAEPPVTWEQSHASAESFDAPLHGAADHPPHPAPFAEDARDYADHRVAAPAPVFMRTVESTSGGSGWRVIALGAGVALLVLAAVAVWLFGLGRQETTAPAVAETKVSEPAQQVEEQKPVAQSPTTSQPASPASPSPDVPPVVQEPPTTGRTPAPARREPTRSTASPSPSTEVDREPAAPTPTRSAARTAKDREAAVPSRVEATASGRILVRSTPAGATVLVDGTARGQTPAAIRDLALGSHVIVVTTVGYPQWQQTITLTEDRPSQSFEVSLDGANGTSPSPADTSPAATSQAGTSPGTSPANTGLQVDSRPVGAQVFVDGMPVGVTPLQLPGVAVGSHSIRIELAGYRPWTTSTIVTAGQRTRVAASLEQ